MPRRGLKQKKLIPYEKKKIMGVKVRLPEEIKIDKKAFKNMSNYYFKKIDEDKRFKSYSQKEKEGVAKAIANYKLRTGKKIEVRKDILKSVANELIKEPHFQQVMRKGAPDGLELEIMFENALKEAQYWRVKPVDEEYIIREVVDRIVEENPNIIFYNKEKKGEYFKNKIKQMAEETEEAIEKLESEQEKQKQKEFNEKYKKEVARKLIELKKVLKQIEKREGKSWGSIRALTKKREKEIRRNQRINSKTSQRRLKEEKRIWEREEEDLIPDWIRIPKEMGAKPEAIGIEEGVNKKKRRLRKTNKNQSGS